MDNLIKQHSTQMKNKQTTVRSIFFSRENRKRLQKQLREAVKEKSGYVLEGDQNDSDLIRMMGLIYEGWTFRDPQRPTHEVKSLNRELVKFVSQDMIENIEMHYHYLKEIDKPLEPFERGISIGTAGRNVLPATTSIWGI